MVIRFAILWKNVLPKMRMEKEAYLENVEIIFVLTKRVQNWAVLSMIIASRSFMTSPT